MKAKDLTNATQIVFLLNKPLKGVKIIFPKIRILSMKEPKIQHLLPKGFQLATVSPVLNNSDYHLEKIRNLFLMKMELKLIFAIAN
jgi:hypothetical protein